MVSKGSKRFAEICKPHGRMLAVVEELGARQSAVSRWASGDRKPSAPWRLKIGKRYKIGFAEWDEAVQAEAGDAA